MARRERACERAGTLRPVLRRRGTRRGWGRAQRLPTHLVAGDHGFGIGVIFSGIGAGIRASKSIQTRGSRRQS